MERLRAEPPDVLVVDLKIPGLDGKEMRGLELITESLRLDRLRPVIAITGYGSIELARRTLTQGVFDFIEKGRDAASDLAGAVLRALEQRDAKVQRAGNPFTPRTGLDPPVFGGRTEELEFFEERMNRALHASICEHFIVLGDWGIGKTSLLREYKKMCQARGHAASLVPLEPLDSGAKMIDAARSIVEGVLRELPYPAGRLKRVMDYFDSIGISVFGSGLQLGRRKGSADITAQAFLHDTLVRLGEDLREEAGIVVILLDDMENFMAVPDILTTLKSTLSMSSVRDSNSWWVLRGPGDLG